MSEPTLAAEEENIVAEEPKKPRKVKKEVVLVAPMIYAQTGQYLVTLTSDPDEAWLLDPEYVPANSVAPFKVDEAVLMAAPRPARFEKMLEDLLPTPADVRRALWQTGIFDFTSLTNQSAVRRALRKVLPDQSKFIHYQQKEG